MKLRRWRPNARQLERCRGVGWTTEGMRKVGETGSGKPELSTVPTKHATGDLDLIRELPYGPAPPQRRTTSRQMAASDYVSDFQKPTCAEGGVHRWEADL